MMNRKEAIAVLMNSNEYHHAKGDLPHSALSVEAFNMAIEALKEMPVEEYRQRLMEVFHNTDHDELLAYVVMPKDEEFKSLEDIIHRFKFEPRLRGEWKPLGEPDDLGIHSWYICSRCGFRTTWHMVDIFHFCPNCGADMRKEGEKNESDHL